MFVLGWLLWGLFANPQAQIVLMHGGTQVTADERNDGLHSESPHLPFVDETFEDFDDLRSQLTADGTTSRIIEVNGLSTAVELTNLSSRIEAVRSAQDVLIVHVAAIGVSVVESGLEGRGSAELLWDFSRESSSSDRYPVRHLLNAISNCGAKTKLLILDARTMPSDMRAGMVVNEFPRLVEREVRAIKDPGLWVLLSHGAFEQSHFSRVSNRTVFGFFAVKGLQGSGDLDHDLRIRVSEYARYVTDQVGDWVYRTSAGAFRQTPTLLWGGGADVSRMSDAILLPVPKQKLASMANSFRPQGVSTPQVDKALSVASQAGLAVPMSIEQGIGQTALAQAADKNITVGTSRIAPSGVSLGSAKQLAGDGSPAGDAAASSAAATKNTTADSKKPDAGSAGGSVQPNDQSAVSATGDPKSGADLPERKTEQLAQRNAGLRSEMWELIGEAWRLRDELEQRSSSDPIPADYAPHEWHRLQEDLVRIEQWLRSGSTGHIAIRADDLRSVVRVMRSLQSRSPLSVTGNNRIWAALLQRGCLPVIEPASWGAAELLARQNGTAIPKSLATQAADFDRLIALEERIEFDRWLEKLDAQSEVVELKLARQLMALPEIPWAVLQDALSCRRQSEQLIAAEVWATPWIRAQIELADRHRVEGERLLIDEVGALRFAQAQDSLRTARQYLDSARRILDLVREARARQSDSQIRLSYYLSWFSHAEGDGRATAPRSSDLRELITSLAQLSQLLEDRDAEGLQLRTFENMLVRLQGLVSRINVLQARIESALEDDAIASLSDPPYLAGDNQRIELLLSTPLPRSVTRLRLIRASTRFGEPLSENLSPQRFISVTTSTNELRQEEWKHRVEHVEHIASVISFLFSSDSGTGQLTQEFDDRLNELRFAYHNWQSNSESQGSLDDLWRAFRRVGQPLEALFRNLPSQLEQQSLAVKQSLPKASRDEHHAGLRTLYQLLRGVRWLDPRDDLAEETKRLDERIRHAEWHEWLQWQRDRWQLAFADMPSPEQPYWRDLRSRYASAASAIPGQPRVVAEVVPKLSLAGPKSALLSRGAEQTLEFQCQYEGVKAIDAFVVLQFDPELVSVTGPPDFPVHFQHQLIPQLQEQAVAAGVEITRRARHKLLANGAPLEPQRVSDEQLALTELVALYPQRPNPSLVPPAFQLRPSVPELLRLKVRSKAKSPRSSTLIVKLIGVHGQSLLPESYIRESVALDLPSPENVGLELTGTANSWSENTDGLTLHPFANRTTTYQLNLANQTQVDRRVSVEILGITRPLAILTPHAALSPEAANELLKLYEPTQRIATVPLLKLPAGGEPQPIPFTSGKPVVLAAAKAADGKQETKTQTADKQNDSGSTEPPPISFESGKVLVNDGLLLIVTDLDTQRRTIKRFYTASQRPRRFLRPRVGYNAARQRVEVLVTPRDKALIPPGGVKVRCEFSPALAVSAVSQYEDVLKAPDYRVELFAQVAQDSNRVVTVVVSVDDYPRAFRFQVPCGESSLDLPEDQEFLDVRLTAPEPGKAYKSPTNVIDVGLEIDAPPGRFEEAGDFAQVGIDLNRDRDFVDELPLRLNADRQVTMSLIELTPRGEVVIETTVSDYRLKLPVPSLRNAKVSVQGHVVAAGRESWSDPVDVAFDGAPPKFERIILEPGRLITKGTELKAAIYLTDDELSGASKVELGFDVSEVGEFKDQSKPMEAKLQPNGSWTARMPTEDLRPGVYGLLLRTTDKVGNVSKYSTVPVRVIFPDQVAAERAQLANRVMGQVIYGGQPVPNAVLTLESTEKNGPEVPPATADSKGIFEFSKVPPGEYVLKSIGLSRNKQRQSRTTILVERPPALPLKLLVETK